MSELMLILILEDMGTKLNIYYIFYCLETKEYDVIL